MMRLVAPTALLLLFSLAEALAVEEIKKDNIGPWEIEATFKDNKFDHCGISRKVDEVVATFLRTTAELEAIAQARPFPARRYTDDSTLYIGFLGSTPGAEYCERIATLCTPIDDLCVVGREIHWLTQKNMGESRINYAVLEKTLATQATFRNVNTVNRLLAKLAGAQQD